jgi:hypothetical protein
MVTAEKTLVLLVTDFRGLIPQRIMAWDGYDLDLLKIGLESSGLEVRVVGAHQLDLALLPKWQHVAAIYASSQEPRYKQYLQDIMANLHFSGVRLIPGLDFLMAHEDKVFQALRLANAGLSSPRSFAFGNKEQAYEFLQSARFPLVGKSADGFGSKGVCLVRNLGEARRFVDRQMFHRALRKGRPLYFRIWQRIFRPRPSLGILLFQELVPGLLGDWKILIWGDTACGLYRENRKNDFRASGSGRVAFIEVPTQVLDFARQVLSTLGMPWGSLDIGFDGTRCHLLEYQAIHFGLTTAEKGIFYYVRDAAGVWEKRLGRVQVENEMAGEIVASLRSCGWLEEQGNTRSIGDR